MGYIQVMAVLNNEDKRFITDYVQNKENGSCRHSLILNNGFTSADTQQVGHTSHDWRRAMTRASSDSATIAIAICHLVAMD
jgi:hypothetical protein